MPSNILSIISWFANGHILVIILVINNACNIKIILFILASRKRVATNSQNANFGKDRRMAISGMGLCFTALVCKLPLQVVMFLADYMSWPLDQTIMIVYIAITLLVVENAASFFVNISLNSSFRIEFLKMIGVETRTLHASKTTSLTSNIAQNNQLTRL